MASQHLIYGLVDPRDGHLRYVGKSCSGLKRASAHCYPSNLVRDTYHNRWVKILIGLGLCPRPVVLHESDRDGLADAEIFWIDYFRKMGCPLTNTGPGGVGGWGTITQEARDKISARMAGNRNGTGRHHPDTGRNISIAKTGKPRPDLRGKPRPQYVIDAMRQGRERWLASRGTR
jgi:hypothetical protein